MWCVVNLLRSLLFRLGLREERHRAQQRTYKGGRGIIIPRRSEFMEVERTGNSIAERSPAGEGACCNRVLDAVFTHVHCTHVLSHC